MKKWFFTAVMVLSSYHMCFADCGDLQKTKIETFLLKHGVVYQKQWIKLGYLDNVQLNAVIVTDQNNSVVAKGLNVKMEGYNGLTTTAWLDTEEIVDLLKALDFMINTAKTWDKKPLADYTEVVFSTIDGFKLGFYGEPKKIIKMNDLKMFISCDCGEKAPRLLEINHLEEFKTLATNGLALISRE